jgi:hypothetical protein
VEEDATRPESQFAFYLDEPALVTLGVCYFVSSTNAIQATEF